MLKIESINGRAYANGYDIEELIKEHEEHEGNKKRKQCKESKILADPSVEEWIFQKNKEIDCEVECERDN